MARHDPSAERQDANLPPDQQRKGRIPAADRVAGGDTWPRRGTGVARLCMALAG